MLKSKFMLSGLLAVFLTGACECLAQGQNLAPEARRTPKVYNLMNGMPFAKPAPGIEGSTYYNKHWDKVIIHVNDLDEPLDDYYGRYGIYSDEVEVQTPQGVRAIPSGRIKDLTFTDSLSQTPAKFISVKTYDYEGTHLAGLFEVLAEGKMMLLKGYKVVIQQPDFNAALNTGSKDVRIIKETSIYCTHNNELIKVKSKKKLLPLFDDKASQMEAYMKENKLGTEEKELAKAIAFYNSLP